MQIWIDIRLTIGDKESEVRALFDSGSSFTVMGYRTLDRLFGGVRAKSLVKPKEVVLVNGQKITIDGFVDSQMMVEGYMIEERVYLSRDVVEKVTIGERVINLPDVIIGSPTMKPGE